MKVKGVSPVEARRGRRVKGEGLRGKGKSRAGSRGGVEGKAGFQFSVFSFQFSVFSRRGRGRAPVPGLQFKVSCRGPDGSEAVGVRNSFPLFAGP